MIPYLTLAPSGILIANDDQKLRIPLDKIVSWTAPTSPERELYGYPGAKLHVLGHPDPIYVQDSVASIDDAFNGAK